MRYNHNRRCGNPGEYHLLLLWLPSPLQYTLSTPCYCARTSLSFHRNQLSFCKNIRAQTSSWSPDVDPQQLILNKYPPTTNIQPEDYINCFKFWKETTAAYPSGRNLGNYKALLGKPDIIAFFCKMLRMPIRHSFAPQRWKKVLQVIISKDKGQPCVDRLRKILLLEADYCGKKCS